MDLFSWLPSGPPGEGDQSTSGAACVEHVGRSGLPPYILQSDLVVSDTYEIPHFLSDVTRFSVERELHKQASNRKIFQ